MNATANKPVSYVSNELSASQKLNYKRSLVLSQDNLWYLFENEVNAGTRIMSPRELHKDWATFSETVTPERLESLHFVCFDKKATKKELADKVELSVKVWMRLCETAVQRLDGDGTTSAKTGPRAGAKLTDRKYEVVKVEVAANIKLPPQAKTCLAFFAENMKAKGHDDSKGIFEIPEKEFSDYVTVNAARLNTRQDPWRIFQYYRPQLISLGFIRLV